MFTTLFRLPALLLMAFSLTLFSPLASAQTIDATGSPQDFVEAVASTALNAVKSDDAARQGDREAVKVLIENYVLPYVNFEKTTRLAAGRHWRTATPEQRQNLVNAFKNTLIRTYSGAMTKVDDKSSISMQPFRGDANANDVVVRSMINQSNGPAVAVDYRLEKTPEGWKVYDLNVENIWLIQNYRNQFNDQIAQNGIDGLINALNQQNR
ncbi:ABC transporter substrate-binding protein [Alcaligenaceae bacterium 429]|uniref:MlaC/ttg2D family ABC transporter substrate-binding protein n=1 Tax=Paenalcaligenes sp. Me52 TaxID=3392038 RepID=UPI001092848C|nr:ABC transporter substrate-binding protein [Alcaligenaceae bacterium 429]